jgi:hypothetical protein
MHTCMLAACRWPCSMLAAPLPTPRMASAHGL